MMNVATRLVPPYETSGSGTPVRGINRVTPAAIVNVCSAIVTVSPVARGARRRPPDPTRCGALADQPDEEQEDRAVPSIPSSSPNADRMKSLAGNGIRSGDPRPSPVPTRPRTEREPALRELPVADVVHRGGFERVQPVRHAVLHVDERHVPDRAAGREQDPAGEEVPDPPARDPQHDDEDPEEEHRGSEVPLEEQHRKRGAPREEQRAQVLGSRKSQPSDARLEELALRREVRSEEDDDQDPPELGGLERDRSDVGPQARSVPLEPHPRHDRQEQQAEPSSPIVYV